SGTRRSWRQPPPQGSRSTSPVRATLRTEARRRGGAYELALAAALLCGVILAVQSRVNGELGLHVGSMPAAWFSFGSGLLALSLLWFSAGFRAAFARVWRAVRERR